MDLVFSAELFGKKKPRALAHQSNSLSLPGFQVSGTKKRGFWKGVFVREPQMGGQIRRGRIWRFWGAPIFSPEVRRNTHFKGFWDLWTENRGAPKTPKFNHDGSDPPFAAL